MEKSSKEPTAMPKALQEQEQKLNVYFQNRGITKLTKGKTGNEKTFLILFG